MPLTARITMFLLAIPPLWLFVEGLVSGWVSPPAGKPRTRRFQPVQYWMLELGFVAVGALLILGSFLL